MGERFRGVALGYVLIIVQTIVNLAYTPMLLSGIGQSEYGLYQLVGSIAAYMTILESMLTSSALRFYCNARAAANEEEMARTLTIGRFLYRCASVLILIIGAIAVAAFKSAYSSSLTEVELKEGVVLLALLIATIVLNMLNYTTTVILSGNEKFSFIKVVDIVTVVAQPFTVILVIRAIPYAFVISAVQLIVTMLSWIWKRAYVHYRLGIVVRSQHCAWKDVKPMLAFSLTIAIAMIADIVFAKSNQLILGFISGTGAVAVYSIGYQVFSSYSSLGTVLSSVFMPHLSELAAEDDSLQKLTDAWVRTGRLTYYVITAILVGFLLYGMEFLDIWVGPGFIDAYYVSLLMMGGYYIDILQKLALTILQVLNKYSFRSVMYVAAAIINIPLAIVLTKEIGVVGSALASALVLMAISGFVMNVYYFKTVGLGVGRFWREIFNSAKLLPIILVLGYMIRVIRLDGPVFEFCLHCALFALMYLVASFFSFNNDERAFFSRLLQRNKI